MEREERGLVELRGIDRKLIYAAQVKEVMLHWGCGGPEKREGGKKKNTKSAARKQKGFLEPGITKSITIPLKARSVPGRGKREGRKRFYGVCACGRKGLDGDPEKA